MDTVPEFPDPPAPSWKVRIMQTLKGPRTPILGLQIPNTIHFIVFGAKMSFIWVLGPIQK